MSSDTTEAAKVDDDDSTAGTGTELLLRTPEKIEKTEEMGTEFLLGGAAHETSTDAGMVVGSTSRRRKSHVDKEVTDQADENGPDREMRDITADAMSIQPTGYTLETAHVRSHLLLGHVERMIAASVCLSHGRALQRQLNTSMSSLGWRLLVIKKCYTMCGTIPPPPWRGGGFNAAFTKLLRPLVTGCDSVSLLLSRYFRLLKERTRQLSYVEFWRHSL